MTAPFITAVLIPCQFRRIKIRQKQPVNVLGEYDWLLI